MKYLAPEQHWTELREHTLTEKLAIARAVENVEVFYVDADKARRHRMEAREVWKKSGSNRPFDEWCDDRGGMCRAGWYYWFCYPGCMPDSEPYGPFKSETAAYLDIYKNHTDVEP